jgi:hypothetical protein
VGGASAHAQQEKWTVGVILLGQSKAVNSSSAI